MQFLIFDGWYFLNRYLSYDDNSRFFLLRILCREYYENIRFLNIFVTFRGFLNYIVFAGIPYI